MPNERNHGHNQQRMDQSAGHVEDDPAEDPADQEYEKKREKHDDPRDFPKAAARRIPCDKPLLMTMIYAVTRSGAALDPTPVSPAEAMLTAPVPVRIPLACVI